MNLIIPVVISGNGWPGSFIPKKNKHISFGENWSCDFFGRLLHMRFVKFYFREALNVHFESKGSI